MKISNSGLQRIIQREGCILHAYRDSVGVLTIGTGHTSAAGSPKVVQGMTITKAQNDEILRNDLAPIEQQASQYIKVPVTQNQYDAIISVVFNVGPKFWKSTCIQRLNKKDYKGAADAITLWNKPPEIIGRRRSEQQQFLTPDNNVRMSGPAAVAVGTGSAVAAQHMDWFHTHPYLCVLGIVGVVILIGTIVHLIHNRKK